MLSKTYDGEFKLACVNTSTWQRLLVDIYSHRHFSGLHVWINTATTGCAESSCLEMIPMQNQTQHIQHALNICEDWKTDTSDTCLSITGPEAVYISLPLLFYYAVWQQRRTIRCSFGGFQQEQTSHLWIYLLKTNKKHYSKCKLLHI